VNDDTAFATSPISPAAYRKGAIDTKYAQGNHVATASKDDGNGGSDTVTSNYLAYDNYDCKVIAQTNYIPTEKQKMRMKIPQKCSTQTRHSICPS
jgi:hypothetical protein